MFTALHPLLKLLPLIFLAGFVDAIAGGGGLISLPAYLLVGLPTVQAAGSNKFSASLGTSVATLEYARAKHICWREALWAAAGALPGATLGALQLMALPETVRSAIVLIMIPAAAVVLLIWRPQTHSQQQKKRFKHTHIACFVIGLVMGMYDGFFGPGTGTFLILLFTSLIGMDALSASGSAKVVNLTSNIASCALFILRGQVLYALALPAALCAICGNMLGARMASKKRERIIRPMMLIVLALMLIKVAWDLLSKR